REITNDRHGGKVPPFVKRWIVLLLSGHGLVDDKNLSRVLVRARARRHFRQIEISAGQAARFLRAPTLAVRTAPATPPPAAWPMMAPISGVDAELASSGISMPRSWPPAPPPIAPAMVFPIVPRSMFLAAPAATFPPTAPAMIWIRRLMPDMTRNSPDP